MTQQGWSGDLGVGVDELDAEHELQVELTEAARKWLAHEGYDPAFGARPLRRAMQKFVESPLSVKLLEGEFSEGDRVIVDIDDAQGGLVFRRAAGEARVRVEEPVSA